MIDTISITDLKKKTAQVVKQLKVNKKPIFVLQRSKVAAVIVDPDSLAKMQEELEDAEDIKAIEERRNEPTVSLDEYTLKRFGMSLSKKSSKT